MTASFSLTTSKTRKSRISLKSEEKKMSQPNSTHSENSFWSGDGNEDFSAKRNWQDLSPADL